MINDELDTIIEKADGELKWICTKCGKSYCFSGENDQARERVCPEILRLALRLSIIEGNES